MRHWIRAMRLRTLFLSLSCIWGGLLAVQMQQELIMSITLFTLVTALLLQILSNLANDYGDSIHGADHKERLGPKRTVQDGSINASHMKVALGIFSLLSLASGLILLSLAYPIIGMQATLVLLATGLLSIAAAVAYTNGKRPYGYKGLGDISVLIFFGFVAVLGTEYLQSGSVNSASYPLVMAYGCLAVGVLNLNNMRDAGSDWIAGKLSIPVRLGPKGAMIYHQLLLLVALFAFLYFTLVGLNQTIPALLIAVVIGINAGLALRAGRSGSFDPLLKVLSLSTFLISFILQLSL